MIQEHAMEYQNADILFERGKLVRGEGLEVPEEIMKTMDPNKNEIYLYLILYLYLYLILYLFIFILYLI